MLKLNRFKNNNLFVQSFNTLILRVIGIITLFGFTFFLTHNYSAVIIGQYDFIRTFLLVVGSLCLLGTEQSILYFAGVLKTAESIEKLKNIYLKMLKIIFFTTILALFIFLIIGKNRVNYFFNDNSIYFILLKSMFCMFFFCVTTINTETFRALDKIYIAELFRNTFKYLSVIIGSIYLFTIHQEEHLVDAFLVGFIILSIISFILVMSIFNKKLILIKRQLKTEHTYKEIINKSYPMAVSAMAIFLLMSFDIMFLKKYKGNSEVAYYSIAIKLMTIISMIINTINVTVSTKTAEFFYLKDNVELQKIIKKSSRIIFALSLPVVLFFCFFSETLLLFFGENYIYASTALIILVAGQGVCSFFGVSQIYLNMTGRQKQFQYILIIAVVINFTLNRILIPKIGIVGASIAFSTSMVFWNIAVTYFVYKKDKIKLFLH